MLSVDPDHRPTAEQIYNQTLNLSGNQKFLEPKNEFKFTKDAGATNKFQSTLEKADPSQRETKSGQQTY